MSVSIVYVVIDVTWSEADFALPGRQPARGPFPHLRSRYLISPCGWCTFYISVHACEGKWSTPHEVYVQNQQNQVRRVERFLEKTVIYDVVGEQDVRTVLGDQRVERRQLEQNGWMLARQIGKALYANYVMVMERVKKRGAVGGSDFLFVNVMINVGTGAVFESRSQLEGMTRGDREEQRELIRSTYRNIFRSCKKDMLAIAAERAGAVCRPACGSQQRLRRP